MGTRMRSAADYSITATLSVVPDPLEALRFDFAAWGEVVAEDVRSHLPFGWCRDGGGEEHCD